MYKYKTNTHCFSLYLVVKCQSKGEAVDNYINFTRKYFSLVKCDLAFPNRL